MKYILRERDILINELIDIEDGSVGISVKQNEYNGIPSYRVVWFEPFEMDL